MASLLHLVSVVKNVSGGTRRFPFLPPHGARLHDNEEMLVFGNISEAVNRGDRFGGRWMRDLAAAVLGGFLTVVNTPAPILYDATLDQTRMLVLDNGTLGVTDPSWESVSTDSES